jgi:uncharacterized membrane protein YjjP (DUF1212 family)
LKPDQPAAEHPAEPLAASGPSVARDFVLELGRVLVHLSTPAHRIEEALGLVARRLGLDCEFFSTPTALFGSFRDGERSGASLVRAEPGDVDLGKYIQLDAIMDAVAAGRLRPQDALVEVRRVAAEPPRHGGAAMTLAQALNSASLAGVFGGGWLEAAVAGVIGCGISLLGRLTSRLAGRARVFELVAAAMASFLAHAAIPLAGPEAVHRITVTGLIFLVPGLTFTVALTELSTRHLVSGTARLMGAGITFLLLGVGVALGGRLGEWCFGPGGALAIASPPLWVEAACLAPASLAFTVLFQARWRDAGRIVLACAAAYAAARAGAVVLGPALGVAAGAFAATALSNVHARLFRLPARMLVIPSIVLLVPGSVGFRSVALMLTRDVIAGVETAFTMALAATALVAGVLFANLVAPARRAL